MKIINEKQLNRVLNTPITVPIYYQYRDISQTNIIIDEECIRNEFENKLQEIIEAINNY